MPGLTREQVEEQKRRLLWMMSGESVPPPKMKLTITQEVVLCDMALQSLSQEAVRDEALKELAEAVWGNWISQYDPMNDDGAYGCVYCDVRFSSPVDWAKVKHAHDCIVTKAAALKREPNAAGQAQVAETGDSSVRGPMPAPAAPDGWVPVGRRLPTERGRYLVWIEDDSIHSYQLRFWNLLPDKKPYWIGLEEPEDEKCVTHWMPLPLAPGASDD